MTGGFTEPIIQDLAFNVLTPSSQQVSTLGYIQPETAEALTLNMYRFILASIRKADAESTLLLKRLLQGPQDIWERNQARLFEIKDLWDITRIPDDYLQYLQLILGWTGKLEDIPNALDADTKRRLLATSIALWKNRGPEDITIGVIQLTTGAQTRIWNWFDYRWIIDETALGQQHQGRDSWILELPGEEDGGEYYSNLRVVDDGTLDRELVVNLVKLMRPTGERIRITYITFLDLFTFDGDDTQWTPFDADIFIEDGKMRLVDNAEVVIERALVSVDNSSDWQNYVAYFRIMAYDLTDVGMGAGFAQWGCGFYFSADGMNGYMATINTVANQITLWNFVSGVVVPGPLAEVDYTLGNIEKDVYYGLRIQVSPEGATNRIIIYLDANEVINTTHSAHTDGTIAVLHWPGCKMEIDEVEMFQLPVGTDLVDINPDYSGTEWEPPPEPPEQ